MSFGNKGAIGINKVSKEKGDCLIVEEGAIVAYILYVERIIKRKKKRIDGVKSDNCTSFQRGTLSSTGNFNFREDCLYVAWLWQNGNINKIRHVMFLLNIKKLKIQCRDHFDEWKLLVT